MGAQSVLLLNSVDRSRRQFLIGGIWKDHQRTAEFNTHFCAYLISGLENSPATHDSGDVGENLV